MKLNRNGVEMVLDCCRNGVALNTQCVRDADLLIIRVFYFVDLIQIDPIIQFSFVEAIEF